MQVTTGIRSILSSPGVYDTVQTIMGAGPIRRELSHAVAPSAAPVRVLDIGCGTAAIRSYLPPETVYFGFDISREYIDHARRKYRDTGEFVCGLLDEATAATLPKFDVVLALGLLHHLGDTEARNLMRLAHGCLDFRGRLISIDPCFARGQNPIARWLIASDRGQNVRTQEGYMGLTHGVFSAVRGELRHRAWIPYTHWFMECTKQ